MESFVNDQNCLKDADCFSRHCHLGFCGTPGLGDQCNPTYKSCAAGSVCDQKRQRCRSNDDKERRSEGYCYELYDCSPSEFCDKDSSENMWRLGTCVPRKKTGETCTPAVHSECADGHDCHEGKCVLRCWTDRDCNGYDTCHEAVNSYGLCLPKPATAAAFVGQPPIRPIPETYGNPVISVQPSKPTGRFKALERYAQSRSRRVNLYREGAIIVIVALLIFLVCRYFGRKRSKNAPATPSTSRQYPPLPPSPVGLNPPEYQSYPSSPHPAGTPPSYAAYPGHHVSSPAPLPSFSEKS